MPIIRAWLHDPANPADTLDDWTTVLDAEQSGMRVAVRAIDCSGRLRLDLLDSAAARGLPSELKNLDAVATKDLTRTDPILLNMVSGVPYDLPTMHDTEPSDTAAHWLTPFGSGALNLNTAPMPLLTAALVGLDPRASRQILQARQTSSPIPRGSLCS